MTVRAGTGLDEDAAVAVWQAAEAGRGRRNGGTRAQRVRARLRSPQALLLVAEDGAQPVGVLLAELRDGALSVGLLAVHPDGQRQGVGRALVEALTTRYPRVSAWLDEEDDAPATALLAAAGFVPTGRSRASGERTEAERATTAP